MLLVIILLLIINYLYISHHILILINHLHLLLIIIFILIHPIINFYYNFIHYYSIQIISQVSHPIEEQVYVFDVSLTHQFLLSYPHINALLIYPLFCSINLHVHHNQCIITHIMVEVCYRNHFLFIIIIQVFFILLFAVIPVNMGLMTFFL